MLDTPCEHLSPTERDANHNVLAASTADALRLLKHRVRTMNIINFQIDELCIAVVFRGLCPTALRHVSLCSRPNTKIRN